MFFSMAVVAVLTPIFASPPSSEGIDLSKATIVVQDMNMVPVAATVLGEEVAKRINQAPWSMTDIWPEAGPVVVVGLASAKNIAGRSMPAVLGDLKPEGYGISTDVSKKEQPVVWIVGTDRRGMLFGVGCLLRTMVLTPSQAQLIAPLQLTTSPAYPIRGHQIGFRPTANSWDLWDAAQYEQYIRDLALFGANAVENIPLKEDTHWQGMKLSWQDMNRAISMICDKYDLDYWVWMPATFDLGDEQKQAEHLRYCEAFYAACPRLNNVFFPCGDPGDNPPEKVMPYLKELAPILAKYHPAAKIWFSLQGLTPKQCETLYTWLDQEKPEWIGGLVYGPSSPSLAETRARLSKQYSIRLYPDISHVVRAQYPARWLDPAFALTLGREGSNPRPVFYSHVYNVTAPYSNGFLSYSDGVHDDVNKVIWSGLAWDPTTPPREILTEYARLFLDGEEAETIADAILALERNWAGPLVENGGVEATAQLWTDLESRVTVKPDNWRWQLCLLRANYDRYIRIRQAHEQQLEKEVNAALAGAKASGADTAMDTALETLKRTDESPRPELRQRIVDLCEALYQSISLQTSVEKYGAAGAERGAVLDFVDYPLNNRRWLEDELTKVRTLPDEIQKCVRLAELATWETPGPGSFYDSVGDIAKSPHVVRRDDENIDPTAERYPLPDAMWWEDGKTRARQSWITYLNWPQGIQYEGLDPDATYVLRTTGYGECLLRTNGHCLNPSKYGKGIGEIKEFPVPKDLYRDGRIVVTFDPVDEPDVNWRYQSRLCEIWLLKK